MNPQHPHPSHTLSLVDSADPQQFERVRDVLSELLETPKDQQTARLDELAGSDPPLRAAVLELLTLSEAADRAGFLGEEGAEPDTTIPREHQKQMPEWVGPYRVIDQLGEGGSGVVYLAESPAPMHRRVAVKLARWSARGQAEHRANIETEALASLNHPGIAQIFETGQLEDGRRWTACELVEGNWISAAALKQDWRTSVELLAQAAEAVHHAHQRGVIHRDLKPSNLLVPRDASSPQIKVIDFGVARLLSPRIGTAAATEPGLLVGTLAYMSPEQLGGLDVDARTDVYGLGLVATEVLTGKPPPGRSGGLAELIRASQLPVRVRLTRCGGHERDLEAIIVTATHPDPGFRYPSMQHLADDVRRVIAKQPVTARRPDLLWRLRLYTIRHPWFSAVTTFAFLVILSLLAALVVSRAQLASEVDDQRQLISELVTDTLAGLRDIRGTGEQREAMVATLFERHSRRLSEQPNDPALRSLHARLLRERGDIAANLGRFEDAMSDLIASRKIYQDLTSQGFGGLKTGRMHAESIVRVGDVVLERDRATGVPEAMRLYREAMAMQEELLHDHPDDTSLHDDLCWSFDRIGSLGDKWEAMPDADIELWLQDRINLSTSLLAKDPDRTLSQYNLATGYLRLARFLALRQRNEESAAAVAAGLPHIWSAVHSEPDRTMFVQILVGMLSWNIRTLVIQGDFSKIQSAVESYTHVARRQAQMQPGDLASEGILISVLEDAARTMAVVGHQEESRMYAKEALARISSFKTIVSPQRMAELDEYEASLRSLVAGEPE